MKSFAAASAIAALVCVGAPAMAKDYENNVRPPESYVGQWYTTAGGCSYSRAKAPGYTTMWVLIQNPHHIGQPNVKESCPNTL